MINWKYFNKGFSNLIGSFALDKKKIKSSSEVYTITNHEIEKAWKVIGDSVAETLNFND